MFGRDAADFLTLHFDAVVLDGSSRLLQVASLVSAEFDGAARVRVSDRMTVEELPLEKQP